MTNQSFSERWFDSLYFADRIYEETYLELEKILDEEKPSVYGRNKHTYEDVTTLIEYMRKFDFIVEE